MTLPEFLRRIKEADAKESMELFKRYPALHPRENLIFTFCMQIKITILE